MREEAILGVRQWHLDCANDLLWATDNWHPTYWHCYWPLSSPVPTPRTRVVGWHCVLMCVLMYIILDGLNQNTMLPSLFLSSGCLLCKHAKVAEMWILFQSIVSVACILSRPWTWRIGSVPVQMSGCCLAGALSWWRDRLLWVFVVLHWPLFFWEQTRGASSGWAFCVLAYWILLHRYLPSTMIFLQLHKVLLCSCAKLLWSCSLWIWISFGTVKLRLSAVYDLFWGLLGRGDLMCNRGRSERGTVNTDSVQSPRTKFPWIWST